MKSFAYMMLGLFIIGLILILLTGCTVDKYATLKGTFQLEGETSNVSINILVQSAKNTYQTITDINGNYNVIVLVDYYAIQGSKTGFDPVTVSINATTADTVYTVSADYLARRTAPPPPLL